MTYSEAIQIVIDMAEGNKDVWYGQVDIEKEKKAMAIVEKAQRLMK
ncbi:MAG: hypothetical protein IIC76_12890 [Bacteroidetes bacterium]|nr:hypothetical protein [Bacteroidota bacterium]